MIDVLWVSPVPITALMQSPEFNILPRRQSQLSFDYEGEDGNIYHTTLVFEGVEAFKCTYLTSLTVDMINLAYGKVVKINQTNWLSEIKENYSKQGNIIQKDISHLMICFDDGPCYEFICEQFRVY